MTIRQIESWGEILTLHAQLQSRVRIQVSSLGGHLNDWTGTVDRLNLSAGHCFVDGHMVPFHWIRRLTAPSGDTFENPTSMRAWGAVIARRDEEKRTTERVRSDEWFVPAHNRGRVREIIDVPATYKGQAVHAFCGTYDNEGREVLLLARTKSFASSALYHIASGERFGTISGGLLRSGALWLPWHQMMSWCCKRAEELRKGMPPLPHDHSVEQEQERAAWYTANGLDPQDYALWPSAYALEAYSSIDWESLFRWADGRSAKALAYFMTKDWSSNAFPISDASDMGFKTLQTLRAEGLIELEAESQWSLRELAEFVDIRELRSWVAEAGHTFKSRSAAALRDHLIAVAPPFLEERLRKRTPAPRPLRLRMVEPAGWTWAEFHLARRLYQLMTEDLQQYQFNGFTRTKAGAFLAYRLPTYQACNWRHGCVDFLGARVVDGH